ncbi:ATP synthase epsilon chain, chloroplastic [Glycine soja]|uniref:ATP synthase epsilon chain, chloroplastic n=1 Tax=Glycine soja TaxID=3848 RepID=A0A445HCK7_GLYSO|nr:ATP synthase epsilon chain, chloroplastic [Glycine soja]
MVLMANFATINNNGITVLVDDAEKGSDIDPQQALETLHFLTIVDHKCLSSFKIIHLPPTFQSSHATMNAPHSLSHSTSRQLQRFGKASHHVFINCYLNPIAHAKIKLFGDTPFPVFNTILLLIENTSSPRHYQHELTIINCFQHYKSFIRHTLIRSPIIYKFVVAFHNDKDVIEILSFYHRQWTPHYPQFVHFKYNGGTHQIKVRQHRDKFFFANGLKDFRMDLNIYESTTINCYACDQNWIFNLHFTPTLE